MQDLYVDNCTQSSNLINLLFASYTVNSNNYLKEEFGLTYLAWTQRFIFKVQIKAAFYIL